MNIYKILFVASVVLFMNSSFAACTNSSYNCVCNVNYYVVNQGTSSCSCSLCPSGGTSVSGSNNLITSCFYAAGTGGENSSGSYIYTSACYYTN
ncbi:MAG TPA: hypothetical protein PKJ33_00770 [Alphaproteobacteria bacterium]|nr:hypothetical protein [Alphaproteobacteria bacterium]